MTSLNMLIYYTHCYYTFASENECNGEYELQMHLKRGHVCVSVFLTEQHCIYQGTSQPEVCSKTF